jgi:hypothetical protein
LRVLRPFSTRALGGGELETWRVLRGDALAVKGAGGARSVFELLDTSVMDVKASR